MRCMWIDTHCHLDAPELHHSGQHPLALRAQARAAGVALCVYPAVQRSNWDAVRTLAHQTGDAYALDAEGYFHYHSRTDDMIISAGYNIAGPEVEDALLRHPKVAECGVIGVLDEERGQVVKVVRGRAVIDG